MRIAFFLFLVLHGLIHLLGPAKAFGWAEVSQLRAAISPGLGVLWFAAAALLVGGAVSFLCAASWWWMVVLAGTLLSQVLVGTAWGDAKFGTLANVLVAIPVLVALADALPSSYRAHFERDRVALLTLAAPPATPVTEEEVERLPELYRTYLRRMGAVGRPHVRNFRVTFRAEMRSSPTAPWMAATAVQYEFFRPPARLFFMRASRAGLPFDVFHRYVGDAATFQVRIAGLFPMVDERGPEMTANETVTLMNDVLVMAPAAALDLPFSFEPSGERRLLATFENAGHRVRAELTFDEAGDLVGFVSDDRAHGRKEGPARWSTPISDYREIDGLRVGTRGDANWIEPSGEWTYGRFEITSLAYNVTRSVAD